MNKIMKIVAIIIQIITVLALVIIIFQLNKHFNRPDLIYSGKGDIFFEMKTKKIYRIRQDAGKIFFISEIGKIEDDK